MANENLHNAKSAKNDEFYTQYQDIQKEVNAYIEYDKNTFRGKTILLPCDDPEWSNFTKFFAQNFRTFGLKKLISTSFAIESKNVDFDWEPTLFERENPHFDLDRTKIKGKIFTLTADGNRDGKINIDDLQWQYMEGDGDFRSDEVAKLCDEADVIITNPPFSLFREFFAWLLQSKKQFLILGNINVLTYKEIFPFIKNNKAWLGPSISSGDTEFEIPKGIVNLEQVHRIKINEKGEEVYITKVPGVRWLTNLDHGKRHQPLEPMTMEDNLRYNKRLLKKLREDYKSDTYLKYDNYDALEVPLVEAIPSDYTGVMGVPVSFLDKYCPEQFEVLGASDNGLVDDKYKRTQGLTKKFVEDYYKSGGTGAYKEGNPTAGYYANDVAKMAYKRIFIKHKKKRAKSAGRRR